MHNAVCIEELNRPAVAVCNQGFVSAAKSQVALRGIPQLRIVSETIPTDCQVTEQIEAGVDAVIDEIIAGLTKPLTADEKSPKPRDTEKLSRIVFKGNLEEVNRFFYKRGWTDGLPIMPPTEEAVKEMLTGTDLPGEHVVAKILSRLGKATVEKIAINAVMAGALPTYMPLLIAGVQAVSDPRAHLSWAGVGTSSYTPFWIINGPVRHDLRVNSGTGALSPGDIANATIGRALGLIIKNTGGARKGLEDKGVFGNPGKYTMVMAENEEENPWEPLHVEHGFNREDSAVTLSWVNCSIIARAYGPNDLDILDAVVYNVVPSRPGMFCLVLIPKDAKILASRGWTKKEIATFISEFAAVPAYRYYFHPTVAPKERRPANAMDNIRILRDPNWIRIIVAGGPGNYMELFQGARADMAEWVTKKAELPANWDKLVEKYQDIVPTYLRY